MKPAAKIIAALERLPRAGLDEILDQKRALIIAPHPDDESLGCGGLIAAACAAGNPPVVCILTDGAASHPGSRTHPPARLRPLREAEALNAVTILGLPPGNLILLRYEDTRLPRQGVNFAAAVDRLAAIASTRQCGVMLGPWAADPHCDHQAGAAIAAAAATRIGVPLLSYPVWGWLLPAETMVHEPRTKGWRLDIAEHLAAKGRAVAAHQSQYGRVIEDAPDGFCLPPELLAVFARPYEVFIA